MSAECQRCGWDLPYDGDCVVCDENGTFCSQLADALEAAGKTTQPKAKVHSATCWAELMCVPCTENERTLAEAETAGLASKLLDVQRELAEQRDNHNLIVGAYESRKVQLKESLQTAQAERNEARGERDDARVRFDDLLISRQDVQDERLWQIKHWGPAHDQDHDLEDWLSLIDQRMLKLHGDEVITPLRRRFLLIKIAALAAAAVEALDNEDSPF